MKFRLRLVSTDQVFWEDMATCSVFILPVAALIRQAELNTYRTDGDGGTHHLVLLL